jgi:hypothetical protein
MRRSSSLTPAYTWDERSARYASKATGRFVAQATVRAELDATLDRAEKNIISLAESLRTGRISLADWQAQMAREIKNIHLASGALAKGGWSQMAPADWGRVGQKLRFHYERLGNFARQIADGTQRLDGTLARRAALYVQAGRNTYHAVEQREMLARGMVEERNIRHAGDSCEGENSCIGESARGWVPIGEMVPIGARICLSRCRCSVEYR